MKTLVLRWIEVSCILVERLSTSGGIHPSGQRRGRRCEEGKERKRLWGHDSPILNHSPDSTVLELRE